MLAFFAIFPPDELIESINLMRRKYDKKYLKLAPHITIVPPFNPNENLKQGVEELEKILQLFEPFEIQMKGYGCFKKGVHNIAYIDLEQSDFLRAIKLAALAVLMPYGAKKPSNEHFHITIAKRLLKQQASNICDKLNQMPYEQKFLAKYLAYCVTQENKPWQVIELIPIGAIRNARNNSK